MRDLIEQVFIPAFDAAAPAARHDSAVLPVSAARLALTTDSYVVDPLFFPGGDIGKLAVFGTVNDLCMAGAEPAYLSAGFVLEEGFPLESLRRVVQSMADAAAECRVAIVTGDTEGGRPRSRARGLHQHRGVGWLRDAVDVRPWRIQAGDAVIASGDVGRHGIAVMGVRAGLELGSTLQSDCAPLVDPVRALLDAKVDLHCLRDLTRGGLASALAELCLDANVDMEIDEGRVPVHDAVRGCVRAIRARSALRRERGPNGGHRRCGRRGGVPGRTACALRLVRCGPHRHRDEDARRARLGIRPRPPRRDAAAEASERRTIATDLLTPGYLQLKVTSCM